MDYQSAGDERLQAAVKLESWYRFARENGGKYIAPTHFAEEKVFAPAGAWTVEFRTGGSRHPATTVHTSYLARDFRFELRRRGIVSWLLKPWGRYIAVGDSTFDKRWAMQWWVGCSLGKDSVNG